MLQFRQAYCFCTGYSPRPQGKLWIVTTECAWRCFQCYFCYSGFSLRIINKCSWKMWWAKVQFSFIFPDNCVVGPGKRGRYEPYTNIWTKCTFCKIMGFAYLLCFTGDAQLLKSEDWDNFSVYRKQKIISQDQHSCFWRSSMKQHIFFYPYWRRRGE